MSTCKYICCHCPCPTHHWLWTWGHSHKYTEMSTCYTHRHIIPMVSTKFTGGGTRILFFWGTMGLLYITITDMLYTAYLVVACYISKQLMQDAVVTDVLASKCACSKTIGKFLVATMPNLLTSPTHLRSTDFIVGEYCTEKSKPLYRIPTPIRCWRGRGCLLYTIEELGMYHYQGGVLYDTVINPTTLPTRRNYCQSRRGRPRW